MPSALGPIAADSSTLERLTRFFRSEADPWERLAIDLPPQVFGRASHRAFARYLEGPTLIQVKSLDDICAWLTGCEAVSDHALFFEADFWQHPVTFEQLRKGDCEDHALWAWRQLLRLGVAASFTTGLWRETPHAWVQLHHPEAEGILETTAKSGTMFLPLSEARSRYCPGLAVDGSLQTFVYQGYQRLHSATRAVRLGALDQSSNSTDFEIAILAGGKSSRMGRDKAGIRVGGRSLLSRVRAVANSLGVRVRVIRRDVIPGCGPLGGVVTALRQAVSPVVLFLACDAPLITEDLLRAIVDCMTPGTSAAFGRSRDGLGFPFALRRFALPTVESQVMRHQYSLQALGRALDARTIDLPKSPMDSGFNVNTPAELSALRQHFRSVSDGARSGARSRAAASPPRNLKRVERSAVE